MRNTMMGKILAGMTVVALVLVAQVSSAALIMDIKLDKVGGVDITDTNSFNFDRSDATHTLVAGQVLHFKVYLSVTGTNGIYSDDGVQSLTAAFASSGTTIAGNMSVGTMGSSFNDTATFRAGTARDLDADGDLDLGNLANTAGNATTADWYYARNSSMLTETASGSPAFLYGEFDFTVGNTLPTATGTTTITGWTRNNAAASVWKQDGVNKSGTALPTVNGTALTFTAVTVPEPATMAILALGGIGMAVKGLRRRFAA